MLSSSAARACCWPLFSLLFNWTSRTFSAELLPSQLVASRCVSGDSSLMQDFTFLINEFCKVPKAHYFSLPRFLWMIIPPLSILAGFPLFGVICKPDKSAPHHLSCIFIKMLNRTDVNTDPWGTPLVIGLQVEYDLLTTILAWSSDQFFIHLVVHPSSPYCPNLETRILWVTVLKALLKSR